MAYLCLVYALGKASYKTFNRKTLVWEFLEYLVIAEPARFQVRFSHGSEDSAVVRGRVWRSQLLMRAVWKAFAVVFGWCR